METRALPGATDVSRLLTDLLGRTVSAKPSETTMDLADSGSMVAIYADREGQPSALCACDVAAAASLGAALTLLPSGQVDGYIQSNSLDGMALENFQEVCNVLVQLVNTTSLPALSLTGVHPGLPADVAERFQAEKHAAFAISVEGYSNGAIAIIKT